MNPFQQNINIMKDFFKKPIVLVCAILSFVSIAAAAVSGFLITASQLPNAILQHYSSFFNEFASEIASNFDVDAAVNLQFQPETTYSVSIDFLAVLTAVALLLFYVQSKSKENGKTLKAPSVMFRVAAIFSFVGSIIAFAICVPIAAVLAVLAPSFSWMLTIVIPLLLYVLLSGIAVFVFSGSIKKNLSSIYLSNRGAGFFGIITIIGAVISAASIAGETILLISLDIDIITISFMIGSGVISIVQSILLAVIALKYSSYIKDCSIGFVYEPQKEADSIENQTKFCKKCGQAINPDDYFCNHCGTPVNK